MILFVIYLAAAAAVAVDACSCMPETAEQVFSKADWVSRVLVEKSVRVPKYNITRTGWNFQPWNTQIIYAVRHIDVYKSRNSTLPTQIRTAADSAMCGVSLRVGQHLFLAGRAEASRLSIDLCSYGRISQTEAEQFSSEKY